MTLPTDKILHFAISALLVVALAKILPIGWSALIVFFIGLDKELIWDYALKKGTPEILDLIADLIGVAIGFLLVY